mgnify:FL=1
MDVVTKKYNVNGLIKTYFSVPFQNSTTRKELPRNVPKELFTWAPPKTTDWVKEYEDKHRKPPIYKIKLKYLEHYILPVNGPYYAKGYPMYSPASRSAQAQSEDIPNALINAYDGPGYASSRTSFIFTASTSSPTFFKIIPSVSFVKDAEYLWEELITSIRKTGQRTPVRVHQQVKDNGEIHWRVLNGNHRCNALLDIYGPDHEVDCLLFWTREKSKYNTPINQELWENRYNNKSDSHMKIKNHINIHRPATKEDNQLFREKINKEVSRLINSVTGHTNPYNSHNKVNKTYKDYL